MFYMTAYYVGSCALVVLAIYSIREVYSLHVILTYVLYTCVVRRNGEKSEPAYRSLYLLLT